DSLFLHADTLKSIDLQKINYDPKKDTSGSDSGKVVLAYHHVKFYKPDMQGKCDSLYWTSMDSTMHLFGDPVMWSDGDQLTADQISILLSKGHVEQMNMDANSFIIAQEDTSRYNQIKGKKMTGYFVNNELVKIFVDGNGQTLYYAKDSATMIGVNKVDCSKMLIELKDQKVKGIHFYVKPEGTLFPPDDMNPKEALLKGFNWREAEQPQRVEDLFVE
ncbi:MAG TPA: organic solvent tolerance protein OstA, partial [Bacteroidia bacterium]|nr:organic solvent tolerance protein OstA [Bacteroidia bacterium]